MDKSLSKYDIVVIGGGPAGIGAARAAAQQGVSVLLLERQERLGGILPQCIHNGFGSVRYKQDLPGPRYALKVIDEMEGVDIELDTHVMSLDRDLHLRAISGQHGYLDIEAGAVVLAMGCRERTRAQIRLPGSRPAGIYTAGMVQRMVNIEGYMPGREFVILGSGDIGMIMARRLTIEGARVNTVLELLPYLTGLRRNYVQCLEDYSIPLQLSTTVKNIVGRDRLEGLETVRVDEHLNPIRGTEQFIGCDSLLLSVGLIPENELSRQAGVTLDPLTGGPRVDETLATSVPGIYAAGNVVMIHDLVDYVSMDGEKAGEAAAFYVKEHNNHNPDAVSLVPGEGISSIIPQSLHLTAAPGHPLLIKCRSRILRESKTSLILTADNGSSIEFKEPYVRPAEMLILRLQPAHIEQLLKAPVQSLSLSIGESHD